MKCVILAGGLGTRISEETVIKPKPMVEIGGYPIVNVYANLHLKRTRFYVMMYHVNQGMSSPNYFLSPHYPINPRVLKFGLSWNFYD